MITQFTDRYDWKGRLIDDDDEPPILRRHCIKCGAFLPKDPKEVSTVVPLEWENTYNEHGEVIAVSILKEGKEVDHTWPCKKCGREHDGDEMYNK
jgi:hypothetical protein